MFFATRIKAAARAVLLAVAVLPCVAHAVAPEPVIGPQLARAAHDVAAAFYRRGVVFVPGTFDQLAPASSSTDLYPAYGFAPTSGLIHWSLSDTDSDVSTACFTVQPRNMADWKSVVQAMSVSGLTPATQDCGAAATLSAPSQFPIAINAKLALDRRSVAMPTAVTPGMSIAINAAGTVTAITPGPTTVAAVLQAYSGQSSASVTLQVTNSTAMGPLSMTDISATPGFAVGATDCASLDVGQTCSIPVTFSPASGAASTAGRVRVSFIHRLADGTADATPEVTVTFFGQLLQ
ncbi:hypothetical protein [Burkholderia cenocepacia]|uniref:hypothetical protein n=1 Tax=Burkholderia cenocepacia TaxID=95486 RepID=UPI0012376F39|nr:hypothetical protein [Burkholderia cenocepacia]